MILLVVDTQKGITDERLFAFEQVRDNIKTLIETARDNQVEVVFVRHDDGPGTGFSRGDEDFEIFEEFAPKEDEKIFDKMVNSSFHPSTGLCDYVKSVGETEIMIVGLQTNFCIDATIKAGFELGFKMIVPEYTNSTFDNEYMSKDVCYHYYNDFMWPERFASIVSMEAAKDMLTIRDDSLAQTYLEEMDRRKEQNMQALFYTNEVMGIGFDEEIEMDLDEDDDETDPLKRLEQELRRQYERK